MKYAHIGDQPTMIKSIAPIAHGILVEYKEILPTLPSFVSYEYFEAMVLAKSWMNPVLRSKFISMGMIECQTSSGTILRSGQQMTTSDTRFPFAPSYTQNVQSNPQKMLPPQKIQYNQTQHVSHVQDQNIPPPVAQGNSQVGSAGIVQGLSRAPTNASLEYYKLRAMEYSKMGYVQKNFQQYNAVVAAPMMQPPFHPQGNSSARPAAQLPRSAPDSQLPRPNVHYPGLPQQQSWSPMAQPQPEIVQGSQSSMPVASQHAVQQQGVQQHRSRLASKARAPKKQSATRKRKADWIDLTDDSGGDNKPEGPVPKHAKPTPSTSAQSGQERFSSRSRTTPRFTAPPAQGAQAPPVAPATVPAPNPPGSTIYNFNVFGNGMVNMHYVGGSFQSAVRPAATSVIPDPIYAENGPSFHFASPGASRASTRQQPQGPPAMQHVGGSSQSAVRPSATSVIPGPVYVESDPSFNFGSLGTSGVPAREQPQWLPAIPTGHSSSAAEPTQPAPAVLDSVVDGSKTAETEELEYVDDVNVFGDESQATAGGEVAPPYN